MFKRFLFLTVLAMVLQACSTPVTETPVSATEPAATAVSVTETPLPTESAPPVTEEQPTESAIAHANVPTTGITDRATAHDNDNALTFETKVVRSGDEFFRNRFERPFSADEMNYLPDLDIVNFSIISDDIFYYVKISFVSLDAATQSLTGSYGVEIDRNGDGRAELLLVTQGPYTERFSADQVKVFLDVNGDVGGSKINRPDDYPSDGFETAVFDLSQNLYPKDDADFAWVRQATDGSLPAVEIAFKKWIFGGKEAFMWSADASGLLINPAMLYAQDFMSAEEAGAANNQDPNYPIKALAAFDNTCRVSLGFNVTGIEPLGCFVKPPDIERVSEPAKEGPNSTCGQYTELCERTGN
ncbi:MAG: hypothetical protein IT311_01195 [Anaerolineales bacterium]|nr:hypothetical protein [Anaerolineales bacterium]MCZ2120652.1 hypothetical protein [Anaerolineales bacterium]